MRLRSGKTRESGDRGGVIAAPVVGDAFLHLRPIHLVGALPRRAAAGLRRGRRRLRLCTGRRQPQRAQQDDRKRTATSEQRQSEQQDQRQQPVAVILPAGQGLAVRRRAGGIARVEHAKRPQVGCIHGDRHVLAIAGGGETFQRSRIQPRRFETTLVAPDAAARRAQAKHLDSVPLRAGAPRLFNCGRIGAIGQQQDRATRITGLAQQPLRPVDGAIDAMTVHRHHVRRQRIEEQRNVVGIVGQRRHGERIVGKCDQCHLPARAQPQQFGQFRPRLRQPVRRQVVGQRRARQVQRDHQRFLRLQQGLRQLPPAWSGQRQRRQRPSHQRHPPRPFGTRRCARIRLQQMRQQVRVDDAFPDVATPPLGARRHRHPDRNQQQPQQPPRAQEMQLSEVGEHLVHARRSRSASASTPRPSASPSGQGYSSIFGRSGMPARFTGSSRLISE